jgi:hypothetical protein
MFFLFSFFRYVYVKESAELNEGEKMIIDIVYSLAPDLS